MCCYRHVDYNDNAILTILQTAVLLYLDCRLDPGALFLISMHDFLLQPLKFASFVLSILAPSLDRL